MNNDNLFQLIKKNIKENSNIKIAIKKFSLRAFYKLIPFFKKCSTVRIILTDINDYEEINQELTRRYKINVNEKEMVTNKFELKLKNDLMDFYYARETKEYIQDKVEIKYIDKFRKEFILIDNEYTIIDGVYEISLGAFNEIENDDIILITEEKNEIKYKKLLDIFNLSWNSLEKSKDAKQKLINKLESIYQDKTPYDLYQFTNSHLLQDSISNDYYYENKNNRIKFEETNIYQKLYEFQKHGVEAILDKIKKYNGCILADSVGLGKTFEALAIIKYFELEGKRVLVLSPKKLIENWKTFKTNVRSNHLISDKFNYDLYSHTDLSRTDGYSEGVNLSKIAWENYDLVVIDESHNFRNGRFNNNSKDWTSKRYKKLMDDIILKGRKKSVLLLTATPVNNKMDDINNQINIITANNDEVFQNENIKSIKYACIQAEKKSNQWAELPSNERTVEKFQSMIGNEFRKLIDLTTIARSRKQIVENYYEGDFHFPNRLNPISERPNIDTLNQVYDIKMLFDKLSEIKFSIYKPFDYIFPEFQQKYEEEYDWQEVNSKSKLTQKNRENNLVALMRINLLKRFESSVESFRQTIKKIIDKTTELYNNISTQSTSSLSMKNTFDDIDNEEEDINEDILEFKKIKIKKEHIDLIKYSDDLSLDINQLREIYNKYLIIDIERDAKLKRLVEIIKNKIHNPINTKNRKIIIFTSFISTAEYIYQNINHLFSNYSVYSALVTGQKLISNHPDLKEKKYSIDDLLSYFSPISKQRDHDNNLNKNINIDILIATDCISEGQNLQDCDYLINYDIHWNPVRLIQRFGRIDRIGSKNNSIQMVNFWPNIKLEEYIQLEIRINEKMMKAMQTTSHDENVLKEIQYEESLKLKQLKNLENNCIDLEDMKENISFSNMTFSEYTTDLKIFFNNPKNALKISNQPDGIFSIAKNNYNMISDGIIFLFKSFNGKNTNNQFDPYYLIYIENNGNVKYTYSNTGQILSLYKSLTKDQKEINKKLIDEFNVETNFGKDMSKYTKLLNLAISSLNDKNLSNDFEDLFDVNKISSNKNNSEYELISFLIIKSD